MTTIVKVGNAIAIDGQISENGILLDNNFRKFIEGDDCIYLFCGSMCNFEEMAKLHKAQQLSISPELFIDTTMLVFDKGTGDVTQIRASENTKVVKVSPVHCHSYCIGSGRKYAYGALSVINSLKAPMDNESIAKNAIIAASKHDLHTSDHVYTWSV